jgi:20S proteasome alpha/beta subunit
MPNVLWNRRQKPCYYCSFISLLAALIILFVEAPHSHSKRSSSSLSRGRSRQQYDRSITLFSDDGRLLQVEYSAEASNKGSTVACLKCSDKSVCFAVETIGGTDDSKMKVGTLMADKVHRVDDHCIVVTTGLAGDCRFLAQNTRLACQKHRIQNGEPPSIREIANMVAQIQHELTRTSGSRPLAVTTTIIGVDPFSSFKVRLFQCDVAGIVDEFHSFCASGRKRKDALVALAKLSHQHYTATHASPKEDTVVRDGQALNDTLVESQLEETIDGVARAILDAHDESKQVDIWMVIADSSCRGKARFRYARAVTIKHLDPAVKLLSTYKG